ncbi:MAG: hypothetical protein JXX14_00575 [Deltaproteobacteria bacterium]|nr:hypothetical protein [Deltaproteobacteria bacterium]
MKLKLLISPLARGAYFDDCNSVATAEFSACFPDLPVDVEQTGGLNFIRTSCSDDVPLTMTRLSFIQGAFRVADDDVGLYPLDTNPAFALPHQLVFGWKYQGKTNELVTQMAINLALAHCNTGRAPQTLLDPMAGKGTTLLWAVRYGLNGVGIEQDGGAIGGLEAHLKKQTKLHKLKHSLTKGTVGPKSKGGKGRFLSCAFGDQGLRLINGDSREAPKLLSEQRFDLIVTDLPYGVQFRGGPKRSPLDTIKACAQGWVGSLREGGAMVITFNTYLPSPSQLADVFSSLPCQVKEFSAAHRMSESIVRDFCVVTRNSL